PDLGAEHDDGARVPALARHGEFETVYPPDPSPATAVTLQADPPERHVAVQQLHIHLIAMPLHGCQRPLADAMAVPEPGTGSEDQQEEGEIAQGKHRITARRNRRQAYQRG